MKINMQKTGIIPIFHLILVLATIGVVTGTALGADPTVSISPSTQTVSVGDDFEVYIAVDPAENELQMVQIDLGFDSSLANITVEDGGMFGMFIAGTPGTNVVSGITGLGSGVSTSGNFAVLYIHANGAGTLTLDLANVNVGTTSDTLNPIVNGGSVTIEGDGGNTTIADVILALQLAASGEYDPDVDVDGDGEITSLDALKLLQMVVRNAEP